MKSRLAGWVRSHAPTRESIEDNRWLRPFAHRVLRAELWRWNRRSVPRGVALGLFVGIMIPLAHFFVALLLAMVVRANIPAAMAATFVGFPVFYVFIVALAYRIGEWLLHLDAMNGIQPLNETMHTMPTDHLLQQLASAGLDTMAGLFVLATGLSLAGYVLTGAVWRIWIARKRRLRPARAGARPVGMPMA